MADVFVFLPSYYEAIKIQKKQKDRLQLYEAVCEYGINGNMPKNLPENLYSLFILMKPNIDADKKRRKASVENGKKGGAPAGNQNARKQPKDNQEKQPKQPKTSLNMKNEYEEEKEYEEECEYETERATAAEQKQTYGEFQNVFLTDDELEKLKGAFPADWQERIESVSGYMARTGKTYANHYAALKGWEMKENQARPILYPAQPKKTKADELNDFYKRADAWANGNKTQKINREDYDNGDQEPW